MGASNPVPFPPPKKSVVRALYVVQYSAVQCRVLAVQVGAIGAIGGWWWEVVVVVVEVVGGGGGWKRWGAR